MIQEVLEQLRAAGLIVDSIDTSGALQREPVEGDRGSKRSGWYVAHELRTSDGRTLIFGTYGNWKTGEIAKLQYRRDDVTDAEHQRIRAKIQKDREDAERRRAELAQTAATRAAKLWGQLPEEGRSPYLSRKKVRAYGIRFARDGAIVVPVRDLAGAWRGLQFIAADGTKKFLTGTAKKGGCHIIGELDGDGPVLLAEGYATAASVHMATGWPVVVAFDAGNLLAVACDVRERYGSRVIVIAGDEDHATEGNPGRRKAQEAAERARACLAMPAFPVPASAGTDFNDLHRDQSLALVREQLKRALERGPIQSNDRIEVDPATAWGPPIPFDATAAPALDAAVLPEGYSRFADELAGALQVPVDLVIGYVLGAIATAVQGKFHVEVFSGYEEPLVLWTAMCMETGERKTPVFQACIKPVVLHEKNQAEALRQKILEVQSRRTVAQKRIAKLEADAAKAETAAEREQLIAEIDALRQEMPDELRAPKMFVGDVTPERLQQLLVENAGVLSILSDEPGVLLVIAGVYSGGDAITDVFLQAFSGSPIRVSRQSREALIDQPALTMAIAAQPAMLRELPEQARRKLRASGLFGRFLFIHPEARVGTRDMRSTRAVPAEVSDWYRRAQLRLLEIPIEHDAEGSRIERKLQLSSKALAAWQDFAQRVEDGQRGGGPLEGLRDWCAKLPGNCARIAGLLHVAEHGLRSSEVSELAMLRAVQLCATLIPHAAVAFGLLGGDKTVDDAEVVWRWIVENGRERFQRSEVHHRYRSRFGTVERLVAALDVLVGRNLISRPFKERGGGRPQIWHAVNPRALDVGTGVL
jgi:phage/plasmid primase-like uncharacterized protein